MADVKRLLSTLELSNLVSHLENEIAEHVNAQQAPEGFAMRGTRIQWLRAQTAIKDARSAIMRILSAEAAMRPTDPAERD